MNFLSKYPRTRQLLEETGMTLEQALIWTECELERLKSERGKNVNEHRIYN